jgi:very-short-patch-repair endonuclease
MTWPYRDIATLTERQQGQVTRAQLLEMEVGRGAIAYGLRQGRIHETFTGVYAIGDLALPPLWREMGAALTCGEEAFICDHSGAAVWGVRPRRAGDVDVTVPYRRNPRRAGVRVHRARIIDRQDLVVLDGVPVASPALVLLQVVAELSFTEFERAFDDALRRKLITLADARGVLARYPGRPGAGRFAQFSASEHALEITYSDAEQRMKALIKKGGLPMPVLNIRRGRVVPDFIWKRERVIVEVDGFEGHGTRRAFEDDRARDAKLEAEGWTVLRFTWRQLKFEPEVVLVRLAQVLALRRPA